MPRTARLDIPGLLHHVIVRGIERRSIFLNDRDRDFFVERLSTLLQGTQTDCLAWSLMTNHFHLLLRPRDTSLSDFMRRLLTSYAVTFNLRHNRSGHLFQNRYKSLLCDEERYLLELVRYVHLNPLRSGLVGGLDELDAYPWCGHAVVMGKGALAGQTTEEVLGRFGRTLKTGRKNYRSFISDGLEQQSPDTEQDKGLRRWLARQVGRGDGLAADDRILGGEDFSQKVQPATEVGPLVRAKDLPQLLGAAAKAFDIPADLLLNRTRLAGVAEARAVICCLAIREGGHSGADVARTLHMTRSGVSLAVRRGEALLLARPELREAIAS